MSLQGLLPLLSANGQFRELITGLRQARSSAAVQVPDPAIAYAVAVAWRDFGAPVLVLTPQPESARRLVDQLLLWCGEEAPVHHFSETENLPFERLTPDPVSSHLRLTSLGALAQSADAATPPLIVSSILAAAQWTIEASIFRQASHVVRRGDSVRLETLVRRWASMGYGFEAAVEIPGTASRRGGIVDIWPVGGDAPARIELFGDEIESIRRFEPATQRSCADVDEVRVIPAAETLPALADPAQVQALISRLDFSNCAAGARNRIVEELGRAEKGEAQDDLTFYTGFFNHGSVFEYLPGGTLLIVLREGEIEESARSSYRRMEELKSTKERRGEIPRRFPEAQLDKGRVLDALNGSDRRLSMSPWGVEGGLPGSVLRLPFEPAPVSGGSLDRVWTLAGSVQHTRARLIAVSPHAGRLSDLAGERGIAVTLQEGASATPPPATVTFTQGYLRQGFTFTGADSGPLIVLSDSEVFGVTKERRRVRRRPVRRAARLSELTPGVFVVHVEHGVARFAGTTTLEGEDTREYLVLEYADGDKLYVPTEHLDRLQLYHGSSEHPPRLTRLGTQEWTRAKAKARRATEQIAGELIALYAARVASQGLSTGSDTPWQDALEASFPYEETPDQLTTLTSVKSDLETTRPMDRLVCGDVGYGKTEIALRAAFKVVQAGRQVAILVPTTVLAQQHYTTFQERLKAFPVSVEMLSRFRSDAEQRSIVAGLASGRIDICIGTHRLLQQDVGFHNLGLVVIDEEHRFGVTHKERLKRMRAQVDVLAMSATPIPRTLHMSLAGVRDMSTMETPPEERLPIKTYISEESSELVREAILREMDRGGQIFFLHNRVKNIDYVAHKLQELVPEASVQIGHGQMPEEQLEQVMSRFAERKFDVLVCTTIIESGIDLPNVNTLIVNRSDMFGLSQLYQLRGRIGRGSSRAYAYFLVPRGKSLTETAEKRLNTILAATELGAGFQIAMRDLEIRGTGNILGAEQSGHIAAIGFDLYTRLLTEAVAELKFNGGGGAPAERIEDFSTVRVDLGLDTRIPESYVEDLAERLGIYRRLARIGELDAVQDMRQELRDRFGPVPKPVDYLLDAVRARIAAERGSVDSVIVRESLVILALRDSTGGARAALQAALGPSATVGHMQIRMGIDRDNPEWVAGLLGVLEGLGRFRQRTLQMLSTAGSAAGG